MITRIILLLLSSYSLLYGQSSNNAATDSGVYQIKEKVKVQAYLDTYFAYNFNEPQNNDQPYFVSMARHNEVNINLAFIDIKYSSSRVRARVVPGFGTYINSNYARETGSLKNLIEANAGVKVFKTKGVWLEVGVLGSPYSNESAISKDHLAFTRSLSAENVPYYLSGAKLTLPVSKKIIAYLYVINGWQQITDVNSNKALGNQFEFRLNNNLLLNWNTYIGKERTLKDSIAGVRYFSDVYLIYNKKKLSLTSCVYYGLQKSGNNNLPWYQANVISRYTLSSNFSATMRFEYFNDSNGVLIVPITNESHFETFGLSFGFNLEFDDNILLRAEARQLRSEHDIFMRYGRPSNQSLALTAGICGWF